VTATKKNEHNEKYNVIIKYYTAVRNQIIWSLNIYLQSLISTLQILTKCTRKNVCKLKMF